jgi:menaquinone-specific isochorismate synthase
VRDVGLYSRAVASSTTPSESRALDLRAPSTTPASPAATAGAELVASALSGHAEPLAGAEADSLKELPSGSGRTAILRERLALPDPAFVYVTPNGETIAAFGSVARFEASGPSRFQAARRWMDGLAAAAGGDAVPVAVGGFSFVEGSAGSPAGFGDAVFFVPAEVWWSGDPAMRFTWKRLDGAADGTRPPHPLTRPKLPEWTEAEWALAVRRILDLIDSGELDKVVLAREVSIERPDPIDPAGVFESLAREHPGCFRFLFRPFREAAFVGASPERLVSCRDGVVVSDAVAGTAADGALLTSAKDRSEHDFVVRHIVEALAPLTRSIRADAEPSLQRHRRLTHLRTRVAGTSVAGIHVLDLVERVHPTPAVAGSPSAAALETIRSLEPAHRGWYAGAIGWMRGDGAGDFAVGIRSALLHGRSAVLFAGAGIVAGSDPAAEWAETEVKLTVMREAIDDAAR